MNEKIIIFSAPSGSGKTTILKELIEMDLHLAFSVSATSRQQRKDEVDGKDYYFYTPAQFKESIKNNLFVEWEEVYDNQYYGTLHSEIERLFALRKNIVFDVDVLGGLNLKRSFKEKALSVFIMPPSIEELKNRLIKRGTETSESLNKRLEKATYELTFVNNFDKVIVNDNLKQSIKQSYQVIAAFLKK